MKSSFGAALAFGLLAIVSATDARADGFAVNRFEPSERGSDFFAMDSLDLRGHLRPAAGVVGEWGYRPLVIYDRSGDVRSSLVRNQLVLHPGASIVVWDRVRLGVDVPVQVFADGHGGSLDGVAYAGASSDPAVGDMRFAADVRVYGSYLDAAQLAVGAQLWAPTGSTTAYSGDGDWRAAPRVQFAGRASILEYTAKVAYVYRGRSGVFGDSAIGSELALGVGGGLRAVNDKLLFSSEILSSTATDDPFKTRTTPVEALFGIHYLLPADLRAGAGVGTGLARGYGTPTVRGLLGLEYAPQTAASSVRPDRDGDGVPDGVDACPEVAGERTADRRTSGCPLKSDRDKDGVDDGVDACPNAPGPPSDDVRTNGCPLDTDGDGIIDPVDACPTIAGVEQPNPKKTGCPPDSDDDGIIDEEDACPDVPGEKTSDPKTNGCPPNTDRDKDGIANDVDACPDEAGKPDPDPKRNGCPKAFVQNGQIRILDQVKFKTGSAAIDPGKDSEEVLDAVVAVLRAHPEIARVRVEGHTDTTGNAKANKKLSADRAAAVARWLFAHGVGAERVTSAGLGAEKPLESNATEDGKKANRRVEFHIEQTDPEPAPAKVP